MRVQDERIDHAVRDCAGGAVERRSDYTNFNAAAGYRIPF